MGEDPVNPVCESRPFFFVKQAFFNHFLNVIIFLIDNFLLIALSHDVADIYRMIAGNSLVLLQEFDRMPAEIVHVAVFGLKDLLDPKDLLLDIFIIPDHDPLGSFLIVVDHRMHQHIQAGSFAGRHRHHRNMAQHLRKPV